MSGLLVRTATAADLPALQELSRQIGAQHAAALPDVFREADPPLAPEHFERLLAGPESTALVAVREGEVVGLLMMYLRRAPDLPFFVPRVTAHVSDLVVDGRCRRAGIGRALMDAAAAWAREQGATRVGLNVWEFNQDARRFYEALGFRVALSNMVLELAE
jgi:diamine N-acetyltransferase